MNEIEALQEKIAFQEHAIEQLNDALTSQQQQISNLQEALRLLTQTMKAWREESRHGGAENDELGIVYEMPPHY